MIYSFAHYAERYEFSRQRDRCPSKTLITKIIEKGVKLDSVVDFGTGTGFWLKTMRQQGFGKGKLIGVDVAEEMLIKAKNNLGGELNCIQGGINELADIDFTGVDCIFICMAAHFLEFPRDLSKLTQIAAKNKVRHIVIVEEVSFFYYALTGVPHYLELLPKAIQNVIFAYQNARNHESKVSLAEERSSPYPIPAMAFSTWKTLGLSLVNYNFDVPPDLSWSWLLSPSDVVDEIRNRGYSMCFTHNPNEAGKIADRIKIELENKDSYMQKFEIPFWFHIHTFEIETSLI